MTRQFQKRLGKAFFFSLPSLLLFKAYPLLRQLHLSIVLKFHIDCCGHLQSVYTTSATCDRPVSSTFQAAVSNHLGPTVILSALLNFYMCLTILIIREVNEIRKRMIPYIASLTLKAVLQHECAKQNTGILI